MYDAKHPLPKDAANAERLKKTLTAAQEKQLQSLLPKDKAGPGEVPEDRARGIAGDDGGSSCRRQRSERRKVEGRSPKKTDTATIGYVLSRKGQGEQVKAMRLFGTKANGRDEVVWVHPDGIASLGGNGKLDPAAKAILDKGASILAIDVFPPTPTPPKINGLADAGYLFRLQPPPRCRARA